MGTVDKNLLKGIFSIPVTIKKQKNSRFNKLEKRAKDKGFTLEKTGGTFDKYEIFSNEKDPGVVTCCETLREVESEIAHIEANF